MEAQPSQTEAKEIAELLRLDKEHGEDDRGLFLFNDRVYYAHITYGYEQLFSL